MEKYRAPRSAYLTGNKQTEQERTKKKKKKIHRKYCFVGYKRQGCAMHALIKPEAVLSLILQL